jgi:hypothetical protein
MFIPAFRLRPDVRKPPRLLAKSSKISNGDDEHVHLVSSSPSLPARPTRPGTTYNSLIGPLLIRSAPWRLPGVEPTPCASHHERKRK